MTHTGNQYEIRTIADIAALRPEQRAGFLKDLEGWLRANDVMAEVAAEIGLPGKPDTSVMVWIDDGEWGQMKEVCFKVNSEEPKA